MATKKKGKKRTKKTKKPTRISKRVKMPTKSTMAHGCQTRGAQCEMNPSLYRSTPIKKKK
jgi:hypothetical protein